MTSTPQFSIGKLSNVISVDDQNSNRRIGIGTATAQSQLHLHSTNASADVRIQFTDNTTGAGDNAKGFQIGKDTNGHGFISINEAKDLIFSTNTSERMRIDSSGNVGIGQASSASYKLTVSGNLNATTLYENGSSLASKYQAIGSYAAASHTHNYLSTSGGTLSGNLTVTGTVTASTFSGSLAWANITGVPSFRKTLVYDGILTNLEYVSTPNRWKASINISNIGIRFVGSDTLWAMLQITLYPQGGWGDWWAFDTNPTYHGVITLKRDVSNNSYGVWGEKGIIEPRTLNAVYNGTTLTMYIGIHSDGGVWEYTRIMIVDLLS